MRAAIGLTTPPIPSRPAALSTVDMTAEYRITKHFSIRAKVGNLLDKDYETVATYNALGRNVFLSFQYQNFEAMAPRARYGRGVRP